MRRADREVKDRAEVLEIMKSCQTISLAMVDNGAPYVVVVNFGVVEINGEIELCFHTANQGRKIDILRANPNVAFVMSCNYSVVEAAEACKWAAYYTSVYGSGTAQFVADEDKATYMDAAMAQVGHIGKPTYNPQVLQRVDIVKIKVKELTGKTNQPR